MPLRGAGRNQSRPLTFRPAGLSDTVDGTNVFAGAMQQLANLIPDPSTDKMWVPRPAAVKKTDFSGIAAPGYISALLTVGDVAYGLIASGRNPGTDEPFAYNIATNTFYPISGITNLNVPFNAPQAGDWTPPILEQVGGRIIFTDPYFAGTGMFFGWLDISSLAVNVTGDIIAGDTSIRGNPNILGLQPGLTAKASGIPAGATIVGTSGVDFARLGATHTNTIIDGLSQTSDLFVGMLVSGNGVVSLPTPTSIVSIDSSSQITVSQATTATNTVGLTFTGTTIRLSAPATLSTNSLSIAIAGGTPTAPQWAAGNTNLNGLPSIPVGVAQFNGRAFYALGTDGIVFSDSLLPCQVSNSLAVQALTTNDGLAVTAIGPLMEVSAITGGIVQGLIAFEGGAKMQQITGDQSTGDLRMNALPVATGTLAPLSIQPCELGLAFVSPQGLRIIIFSGQVTPPIGDHGSGTTVPFIYAVSPSRIVLAAGEDTIRITVQNGLAAGQPLQEYWYDITRKTWCGPHSFPASQIQPWQNSFIMAPAGILGSLWQSDSEPGNLSVYNENGVGLSCAFQTSLLPDNAEMKMNCLIETALGVALLGGQTVTVQALDENGNAILVDEISGAAALATIVAAGNPTLWGGFNWGEAPWGGVIVPFQQRSILWPGPVVFKQMSILATFAAGFPVRIGNLYMLYQILGYKLEEPPFNIPGL